MPPYESLQAQDILFMFTIGIGLTIAVALARGSKYLHFSFTKPRAEEKPHEFGGKVTETNKPVPILIWLIFIGYFVWTVGYILYSGFVEF
jgi:hypothetical protein